MSRSPSEPVLTGYRCQRCGTGADYPAPVIDREGQPVLCGPCQIETAPPGWFAEEQA